ncbi:MAG TPA: nitroreductase family protein [Casimicrobiaceae bacterium]|nr:nitroreductase family protein [Casimicrobiaceae bacterium]
MHHATFADVMSVIRERRSIRSYIGRKLDWHAIQALLSAAVEAPSAMHSEPRRFLIVQDAGQLARLSERARLLFAGEPHPDLLDRGGHSLDIFTKLDFDIFYGAGTLIVLGVGEFQPTPFAVADCWLAAENLMLAAYEKGSERA